MGVTVSARTARRLTAAGLLACALGAALSGALLWQATQDNRQIDALREQIDAIDEGLAAADVAADVAANVAANVAAVPASGAASGSASDAASGTPAAAAEGSPELRFAQAALHAAQGDFDGALWRYRTLERVPTRVVAARFNTANLMMREAARLREGSEPGQAIALVELAKLGYRAVLRAEPAHWGARYNLERALRLQPDPEVEGSAIGGPRNDATRASTAVRGVLRGLP